MEKFGGGDQFSRFLPKKNEEISVGKFVPEFLAGYMPASLIKVYLKKIRENY